MLTHIDTMLEKFGVFTVNGKPLEQCSYMVPREIRLKSRSRGITTSSYFREEEELTNCCSHRQMLSRFGALTLELHKRKPAQYCRWCGRRIVKPVVWVFNS